MRKRSPKSKDQLDRAGQQRQANLLASEQGQPLPFPNIWDALDPTKLPRDATKEQVEQRYREFRALCPPRPRKQHVL